MGAAETSQDNVTRVGRLAGANVLAPVKRPWVWYTAGLLLQAAAIGVCAAWGYDRYKHDAMMGAAVRATVLVVWQDTLDSWAGRAVLLAAAVLFAVGSVLLARPYVRSATMLLAVVPLAAIAGLLVLGLFAVVLAILFAMASAGFDGSGLGGGGSGKRKPTGDVPEQG